MQLNQLDHVNVRTNQLAEMTKFYESVLGMRAGDRPNFDFNGAWLYIGDRPVVHLVEVSNDTLGTVETDVTTRAPLRLEHFAFAANGSVDEFEDQLRLAKLNHQRLTPPGTQMVQIHLRDPDGNHIHIDFTDTNVGVPSNA